MFAPLARSLSIRECGSNLYVGLTGTFQSLIQKSMGMNTPNFLLWVLFIVLEQDSENTECTMK